MTGVNLRIRRDLDQHHHQLSDSLNSLIFPRPYPTRTHSVYRLKPMRPTLSKTRRFTTKPCRCSMSRLGHGIRAFEWSAALPELTMRVPGQAASYAALHL